MFCSDQMSGSHLMAQTSKLLLIDATAVTLSQGNGKVIQYISPDPYILLGPGVHYIGHFSWCFEFLVSNIMDII